MKEKKLSNLSVYENPKHPAVKVRVYKRNGFFHMEYNMPMARDQKESRSTRIHVDRELWDVPEINPDWWKQSSHQEKIQLKIWHVRFYRWQKIRRYLLSQGAMEEKSRDPKFEWVVSYLLRKDKPLIARHFIHLLLDFGVLSVLTKMSKKELFDHWEVFDTSLRHMWGSDIEALEESWKREFSILTREGLSGK